MKDKVKAAFHEVHANEPSAVAKTRKKKGSAAAERQRVAIALSKARAAGAHIPARSNPLRHIGEMCYMNDHK